MNSKSEQILEAIEVLMDEKVSGLQFDKTIQATVQSVEDLDTGEYRVEYKDGIISAFAADPKETYKQGDAVYVTVPEGDFSNKKFISHRITNNSLSTGQYSELANTIFEVSPNFSDLGYTYIPYEEDQDCYGLIVGRNSSINILQSAPDLANSRFKAYADQYEYIQISASFYNEFTVDHEVGDYGIELVLTNLDGKQVSYFLNLNDFNGDPYHLATWSPQSAVVKIPKGQIKAVNAIKFYETGFVSEGNKANLFMSDFSLNFVDKVDLTETPYYLNILPLDGIAFTANQTTLRLEGHVFSTGEELSESSCLFQWFERDLSVAPGDAVYDKRAGWGWKGIVASNLVSWEKIDGATRYQLRRLNAAGRIEKTFSAVSSTVLSYRDTEISSDALTQYRYVLRYYNGSTWSSNWIDVNYSQEYFNEKTLTVSNNEVPWQKSYKLIVVYNSTTLMTKEITVLNGQLDIDIEQVTQGNAIYLKLTKSGYTGDWYYLASDGNQVAIPQSPRSGISPDIVPYLLYSPMTFYCQVYQESVYQGELNYVMQNIESKDDVSVVFSGETLFSYDANGDINIYDAELERSLQAEIVWKKGIISSSPTIRWLDFENNVIGSSWVDYSNKDSMLKKVRVDTTENILYYTVKHKFKQTPSKNNSFRIEISTTDGQVYSFDKEIVFTKTGDPGTNGTRYQSLITVTSSNKFVGVNSSNTAVTLECKVYKDQTEFSGADIIWTPVNLKDVSQSGAAISVKANNSDRKRYVKATINITDEGKSTTLYDFFPIDSCASQPVIDISELPKYVQYAANGRNPQFRKQVPIIWYNGSKVVITSEDDNVIKVNYGLTVLTAGSKYYTDSARTSGEQILESNTNVENYTSIDDITASFNFEDSDIIYYTLKTNFEGQFKLVDEFNSSNLAELSQIGLLKITTDDGKIIYHPVPTYINTFGNEAINGWDGVEVSLGDNPSHSIFAPQIGAGTKDRNNNKFTGVIMGRDSAQKSDTGKELIGLYGYQGGETSFALMENGKAFFGKAGAGRIDIDGNRGIISGGGTGEDPNGMTITLTAKNESATSEAIKIGGGTFSVNYGGKLVAQNAEIKGKVTANSGVIGSWNIYNQQLNNKSVYLTGDNISYYDKYKNDKTFYLRRNSLVYSNRALTNKVDIELKYGYRVSLSGYYPAYSSYYFEILESPYQGEEYYASIDSFLSDENILKLGAYYYTDSSCTENPRNNDADRPIEIISTFTDTDSVQFNFIRASNENRFYAKREDISQNKPSDYYRIWAGNANPSNAKFSVTNSGALKASDANITGEIKATRGYIGGTNSGWIIDSNKIYSIAGTAETENTTARYVALRSNGIYAIWAGNETASSAPFSVTHQGKVTATSATISGAITAISGKIGNWKINNGNDGALRSSVQGQSTCIFLDGSATGDNKALYISYSATPSDDSSDYTNNTSGCFFVTANGKMYAQAAQIKGTIKSKSGEIGGWTINRYGLQKSDDIYIYSDGSMKLKSNFAIDTSGNVTIRGDITAKAGYIGWSDDYDRGWAITGNTIYSNAGEAETEDEIVPYVALRSNGIYAIWAGNKTASDAPFSVTHQGKVTATSGKIGNWKINNRNDGALRSTGEGQETCIFLDGSATGDNKALYISYSASPSDDDSQYTNTAKGCFFVTANGRMYAQAAQIKGTIKSKSGEIGGWTIASKMLSNIANETTETISTTGMAKGVINGFIGDTPTSTNAISDIAFWAGMGYKKIADGDYRLQGSDSGTFFAVTHGGKLYCRSADIKGSITATTGNIGGWKITSSGLQNEDGTVWLSSSGGLHLGSDFSVSASGYLQASGGKIGDWFIRDGGLYNTSSGNNSSVYLSPTGLKLGQYLSATANGLTISGGTINVNNKFKVDANGNVTLDGTITWGSSSKPWSTDIPDVSQYITSTQATTLITEKLVASPTIIGAKIYGGAYYDLAGNGQLDITSLQYHTYLKFGSPGVNFSLCDFGIDAFDDGTDQFASMRFFGIELFKKLGFFTDVIRPQNKWDFSDATVTGITAIFG